MRKRRRREIDEIFRHRNRRHRRAGKKVA
jgi:hypothetical protein